MRARLLPLLFLMASLSGCYFFFPNCGDGFVDSKKNERCDDANQQGGDGCEIDCTLSCGNRRLDPSAQESCDDGNHQADDGCGEDCQLEIPAHCGDSRLDPGEECDDGNP